MLLFPSIVAHAVRIDPDFASDNNKDNAFPRSPRSSSLNVFFRSVVPQRPLIAKFTLCSYGLTRLLLLSSERNSQLVNQGGKSSPT